MGTEIKGFSVALLKSLKVGDTFNTEGFFQGIVPAPCVWTVESMGKDNGAYTLRATYFGVAVGKFFVSLKKNKYQIEEMAL
jgi:hypothetical protein